MLKKVCLMPGDCTELNVSNDTTYPDSPFVVQDLRYIQESAPSVQQWLSDQGIKSTFALNCKHSWDTIVPPSLFNEHPEWFALRDGKRVVTDWHKLETTNQELVEYIARDAAAQYAAGTLNGTYSLSPPDMYEFSESAESLQYYEHRPDGRHPSVTRLIVQFYRDVCEAAKRLGSEVTFSGYLYSVYLEPPQTELEPFPDNFYPVLAPQPNYGYRLYRPATRKSFEDLLRYWGSKTANLYYYDLPCWIAENSFIITPAATTIIDYVFETLVSFDVKGLIIYGMETWGQAAISNYIIAQKLKTPARPAKEIRDEWLNAAYGGAASVMMQFYDMLEQSFDDYYNQYPETIFHLNDSILRDLYAPIYNDLDQLLSRAFQAATDREKERLTLLFDNFGALGWLLKKRGFLNQNTRSLSHKTNAQIIEMTREKQGDFRKYPKLPINVFGDDYDK